MQRKHFFVHLILAGTIGSSSFLYAAAPAASPHAPLFDNLGTFHREISTRDPLAQRFFNQGLVFFYGFEWGESVRSFKEATRLDAECGMCYW
jgi:hypothetical protein